MKLKSYIFEESLEIDFIPTLAFLFFENDRVEVVNRCYRKLKEINPNIEVVGVNGKRGNLNNQIPFITKENQISLLLFDIDDFFVNSYDIENLAVTKVNFINDYQKYNNAASIIFFPFHYDANNFLDYIQDKRNMNNIYGGVYAPEPNGAFYNGKFVDNEMISVFFNQDKIAFFSIAIHGWQPIGTHFKVTKSEKNIVYEVEHETALKVIEDYIGTIKQENIDNFLHPFCVTHNDSKSLASIKFVDRENGSIGFFKYIYEGEELMITIPVNQKQMMKLIEETLKDIDCDGLFMFSCVGRYAYYKDLLEFEIEKVADFLNVPFAGFLTYGEIGSNSVHTKSILQNQTMNLIFFKDIQC